MATATVTELVTTVVTSASSTATSTNRAAPQGGILEGGNPTHYDTKNPIILFIIQAGIIIIFCRLLHWPLAKIRQPRVIAEVIGGILLGPSVMGRIPGFTNAIFPTASMPALTLAANLGLVLFLFLVGLEVDLRFLVSNWRVALSVGTAGMALPFGLGCAIAWGLYNTYHDEPGTVPISFGVYTLFIGVAMAITAFPVLCRILTELKLLGTPVGVIVLSAGVGNDVVGWILLALCVALVNAGTGLTALWVLLVCVGWTLFMVYAVRPSFIWVLNKTRSLQDGPTQSVVALTLLIALTSSFFTGVIGVHPIFGAFIAGLICPHDGGFAVKLTEKIEDLISTLLLPLYFALSGLSTNLGLLDSGTAWGYVVGVTSIAFVAKIVGGSGAARLNGLVWRECFTIGALMSCKGLVELIVLNIGLQAKILSTRTFTIFVVMALVTTFATTPLVSALYPPWYQKKLEAWKRGEIDWATGRRLSNADAESTEIAKVDALKLQKILVYLRLDSMPNLLTFISLIGGSNQQMRQEFLSRANEAEQNGTGQLLQPRQRPISAHGVRLLQLTERDSSVMKVAEVGEYSTFDPVVNTFKAFGRLNSVAVSGEVSVVPESYFPDTLTSKATHTACDMLLLPWSESGSLSDMQVMSSEDADATRTKLRSEPFNDFVRRTLQDVQCNVAIYVSSIEHQKTRRLTRQLSRTATGISLADEPEDITPAANPNHHIFLPYFGTADDHVAAHFVLQLVRDERVTATIVYYTSSGDSDQLDITVPEERPVPAEFYYSEKRATVNVMTRRLSLEDRNAAFLETLQATLPMDVSSRVIFSKSSSDEAAADIAERLRSTSAPSSTSPAELVIVGRNASAEDSNSCLGVLGDYISDTEHNASLVVVQSSKRK